MKVMGGYRYSLLFGGWVSGIKTTVEQSGQGHRRNTNPTARTAEVPSYEPESVVLSEAPIPDIVPTNPCARLNRPAPAVRSATISAVRSNDLSFQQFDRSGDAGFDSLQEIVLH